MRQTQVAIHTHAGQEEDAAKEVDGEEQVREFTRNFTEGPVAVLGQRAHPYRQSSAHAEIRNCQVSNVHVRLVARAGVSLCTDVDPEDQGVGGQADDEDESVEDTHGVQQSSTVERCCTHHRFHTWYVAECFREVEVPERLPQVLQLTGA